MAMAESSALSVLSPLSIVSLLIVVYLVNRIVTKIYHELCLTRQFNKLPKFSHLGLASWVLGNVDIYFYAMSHLRVETAVLQIISSVYAIDSLRKIGFARFTLGYLRMVAFYRADTVEELVTSLSNVTKGHQYDYFKPWLGLGLLTSTGEHWKRHRKLLTPAFHFKILETFFPIMNKNVRQMLTRVEGVRKNEAYIETDIRQLITDMTLDTICETAMGTSVGAQSDTVDHQQYIAPIDSAMILFMDRVINPMFQSDFIYSLSPSGKQNRANMAKIHRFISKVIKDRREELEKSIQEHKLDINLLEMDDVGVMTKKRYAFLDSLLVTHLRNPKEFTKKDIHDEVNTFMFEGHDTTSVGLIFALLLISSDTKVQDKIYEEIVNIVNEEEPIMLEHCRQMKYLEMCIKESLRLYPPVPSITRKVEHDFTVSGYRIPAGITASIHMYLLHRDPSVFPQPERFIPERFEPDAAVHRMPYAYMPFSAGPRNKSLQESANSWTKWIIVQLSNSPLAGAIALIVIFYLIYRIGIIIWNELRIIYWYRKLPYMRYVGIAGWILGNADVYYYYMRHNDRKKVVSQLLGSMYILGSSLNNLQQHGMTRIEMGFQRIVAFWEADSIDELVTSGVNIEKSEQYRFFVPWLGTGLFTSAAEKWRQNRKLLTPAFHFNILQSFLPIMNENIKVMLDRIDRESTNKEIDVRPFISDMTLDTICETAMGVTIGAQSGKTIVDYVEPLNTVLQVVMDRILNPVLHLDFIFNRTPQGKASKTNISKINEFIRKIIKDRKMEFEKLIEENKLNVHKNECVEVWSKKRYSFLDSLLVTSMQNPEHFTEKDIHDQVNTFMFGGHDTNSVSLIFSCLLIANDQRVQDKIVEELKSIFGEEKDRPITADDCREMKYLEMCIKESLRIYPPAPLVARKITEDFVVRGFRIPAGCTCAIFIYLLHRNQKLFPQPERFIPERFEPNSPIHKMPYAYIPFSAGPRNCIGQKFAMFEMKIVLASILRKYQLIGITKRDQVDVEFSILLKPSTPVMIRFDRRN